MNKSISDLALAALPSGRLAIEPGWGIDAYSEFLSELAQIAIGIPASEMMYGERRKTSMVSVIETSSNGNGVETDRIAIVNINGVIKNQDAMCSIGMMTMADQLLKRKHEVSGAIFNISSGGGYTDAMETMVTAIKEFGKPTVTITQFAASAAYGIASATDQIFLKSVMSQVGSIGTFLELNKKFREEYKEKVEVIYADTSPNKNLAFRKWLDEDMSGMVEYVNEMDGHFMKLVKSNRNLLGDSSIIKETLAGGMFFAKDAISRGLADAIGDTARAINTIQKLSK